MEVNAKFVFTFLLGVTVLASGFVIQPYENIDYELPGDIPEGDKSLDLEVLEPDTNYTIDQEVPETTSTTATEVATSSTTTTPTVVYDPDDSYDDDCDCPPQFLIYVYDRICK